MSPGAGAGGRPAAGGPDGDADAISRVRLTVVGCAGSFPAPDSPASCYLVEFPEPGGRTRRVLLDLGSGALGPLQRLVDLHDLDAVLLSHLHPDHFLDLCGLYVGLKYDPTRAQRHRLPVYGPSGTSQRLHQAYGSEATQLDVVFDVRVWSPDRTVGLGTATVTPLLVNHPVEAYGFRLEVGGAVLTYTGDTDSCPALDDLARDTDLLLAEASFQENREAVRGVHLTGLRAGQAAAEAGAGQLLLTHLPVWTDPAVVLAEARSAFAGAVTVVGPGQRYDL